MNIEQELNDIKASSEALATENAQLKESIQQLASEKDALAKGLPAMEENVKTLTAQRDELTAKVAALEAELAEASKKAETVSASAAKMAASAGAPPVAVAPATEAAASGFQSFDEASKALKEIKDPKAKAEFFAKHLSVFSNR